ncbi:hypothetical protein LCGC14_2676190, partial [marine sediment metagenome]
MNFCSEDYFVTKCCNERTFYRTVCDKEHVICIKCKKVTGIKLVKFWKEEFNNYEVTSENYYNALQTKRCSFSLNRLVRKYFKIKSKVKIKARKGKIVI